MATTKRQCRIQVERQKTPRGLHRTRLILTRHMGEFEALGPFDVQALWRWRGAVGCFGPGSLGNPEGGVHTDKLSSWGEASEHDGTG
jgi:hypothetical protein